MEKLTKPTSPRFSLGRRWDDSKVKVSGPGPGHYTTVGGVGERAPTMKASKVVSFGASRHDTKPSVHTAGPGAYDISSQMGTQVLSTRPSSPMPSFAGRVARKVVGADVMGPGVCRRDTFVDPHSAPNKRWAPRYSFGMAHPAPKRMDTPGPGECVVQDAYFPDKRAAPAFTLSGRQKIQIKSATTVGPGRCREDSSLGKQRVSTQKNAPSFSFGQRSCPSQSHATTPGPGAYG
ncbi:hypothetical protein CTAYLR_008040 [Chrysophaeum taylorii]|uniref:Flagellar associated protein n=1 Tax=Chrysophaeum taylorii TaxID=2483200 RepID=A0AAD7U7X1_9STRA|nr:hypothetical protein CTAYLR_008040 [Chrysophaeum taylorii]